MKKSNVQVIAAAAVGAMPAEVQYPSDESMRKQGMATLSARIRHLSAMGASTSQITKIVKRENGAAPLYQHVRNVLNTPLKGAVEASVSTPAAIQTAETE
jgi:hypothetical protein